MNDQTMMLVAASLVATSAPVASVQQVELLLLLLLLLLLSLLQAMDIVHPWTLDASGQPLLPITTFSIAMIHRQSGGKLPLFVEVRGSNLG
jgi:hypothetical protein